MQVTGAGSSRDLTLLIEGAIAALKRGMVCGVLSGGRAVWTRAPRQSLVATCCWDLLWVPEKEPSEPAVS